MRVAIPLVLLALILGFVAWIARDLSPPRSLVIAAGIEGGGYYRIAERYREILARDGIDLELRATAGAVENAALLAAGAVDVGLIQGGVATSGAVESLGAVMIEPLLVFTRLEEGSPVLPSPNPANWSGLRFATGAEGSGTRAAADAFAVAAGLVTPPERWATISGSRAERALLAGEVDAAIFVAPLEAPYLLRLFNASDIALAPIAHLTALSRRMPQSSVAVLPSGALSLMPLAPRRDEAVIVMVGQLVAREGLHPALIDRLVEAAREVHGGRGPLQDEGRFPSVLGASPPMNAQARDLIEQGPSVVRAWLPWWAAAQIDRLALLLLPILFVVYPALSLAPMIYAWGMRRRVYRFYTAIRAIEREAAAAGPDETARLRALVDRLVEMDAQIEKLSLPVRYREYAYEARVHLDLVRRRIANRLTGAPVSPRAAPETPPPAAS